MNPSYFTTFQVMNSIYFFIIFISAAVLSACNARVQESHTENKVDTIVVEKPSPSTPVDEKVYANERFKDVTVTKTGAHTFLITGKGQIFEANFGWVVEDGHDELLKGNQMTDAGAPEWGKFSFTIDIPEKSDNSTLTLILFESSPKDGSRQFELPVVLN